MKEILLAIVEHVKTQALALQSIEDHVKALDKFSTFYHTERVGDLENFRTLEKNSSRESVEQLESQFVKLQELLSQLPD